MVLLLPDIKGSLLVVVTLTFWVKKLARMIWFSASFRVNSFPPSFSTSLVGRLPWSLLLWVIVKLVMGALSGVRMVR